MRLNFKGLCKSKATGVEKKMKAGSDFEEKATYSYLMKAFVAMGAVAILIVLILSYSMIPESLSLMKWLTLLILLISLVALWLFFDLKFGVRGGNIYAKTGPFSFRIDKRDIEKAEIVHRIPLWAGWGVRIWWYRGGLALAFVSSHKPALLLRKKSGLFKQIVFTVENPEAFAKKAGLKITHHS